MLLQGNGLVGVDEEDVFVPGVILEGVGALFLEAFEVEADHEQVGVGGEAGDALAVRLDVVDGQEADILGRDGQPAVGHELLELAPALGLEVARRLADAHPGQRLVESWGRGGGRQCRAHAVAGGDRDFTALGTCLVSGTELPKPSPVFPRYVEPEPAEA